MRKYDRNHLSHDELAERIRRYAGQSRENLQIAGRMEELFPDLLKALKRQCGDRGARGERRALTHPDYADRLIEYIAVLGTGLTARIQFETHRMLLQAWQSENAYQKALQARRSSSPIQPKQTRVD